MVTGGQRSGKSEFAERTALKLSDRPVYVATAEPRDEEFRHRVMLHQQRRGNEWTNIEETICIADHDLPSRTVLVDCVTNTNVVSIAMRRSNSCLNMAMEWSASSLQ